MPIFVKKSDGTLEPLDYNKIKRALKRAGASRTLADEVMEMVQGEVHNNITTREIYEIAFSKMKDYGPGAAARFGLKNALIKLGPDGYPFETFVGALLKGRGYETKLRQIVQGKCVSHEIDVIANRGAIEGHPRTKCIIECKFHNLPHLRCHIQSALYSWARFLDIRDRDGSIDSAWLATNTKFTGDVIQYGDCVGLKLLGWSFPQDESIQVRIEENKLYPTTVISNLDRRTFSILHENGIILVKELLLVRDEELERMGIRGRQAFMIKEKAREIMSNK